MDDWAFYSFENQELFHWNQLLAFSVQLATQVITVAAILTQDKIVQNIDSR